MCLEQVMELLRGAIAKSKLTQEQIAEAVGIDKGVISRLVRGERQVKIETAQRIAEVLGYEIQTSAKLVKRK